MSLVPAPTRPSFRPPARRPRTGRLRGVLAALAVLPAAAGAAAPAVHAQPPALSASTLGEPPQGQGVFRFPQAVAMTAGGTRIYVGDQYSGVVQVFDGSGTWIRDIGMRASRDEDGRLGVVGGVAVDKSGHLYVLDAENDRIEVFDAVSGAFLKTIGDASIFDLMSGSASAGAGIVASGLAVYQSSPGAPIAVYVADSGNDQIERLTLDSGSLNQMQPIATSPKVVANPQGVTLSADGSRLYVADDGNHRVVVMHSVTFDVIAQTGSLGAAPVPGDTSFFPYDVAVDGGSPAKLYVADNLNGRVQVFDANTLGFLTTFGRLGYGPGLGNLEIVRAVHSDPTAGPGVAVADTANNRVQRFDGAGNVVAAWGIAGRSFGYVSRPRDVAFTPGGGIAVADTFDQRISIYDTDGTQVDQRGLISPGVGYAVPGSAPGQFELPSSVAYTSDGSMWVSDTTNKRVIRENADGAVVANTQPGAVDDPRGLAPSAGGVMVASRGTDSVVEVHPDGTTSVVMGGLADPIAIASKVDGSEQWVADDHRIRRIPDGATIAAPSGSASGWDHPTGLAFDVAGTLYVSEQRPGVPNGARVLRGTPNGVGGYAWDLIASEGAGASDVIEPAGLAVRPDGSTLLVADSGNNRVLRFDAPGSTPPSMHRVNVAIDRPGLGSVSSDLPGIACVTDCTQAYGAGRTITLTASARAGQLFTGWGGDCAPSGTAPTCALAMGTDHQVTASFATPQTPAPAPVRPKLATASIRPKTLHPARRASKRLHRKARRATRAKVRVALSKPAKIELAVLQGRPGRREGSACKPQTRKNRKRGKCTRFAQLKGVRTYPSAAKLTATFTPTWRGKVLPAGKYRLAITLIDADGTRIGPITRAFDITR